MTFKNKILCGALSAVMVLCFACCETGDIVETGTPAGVDSKPSVSVPEKPNISVPTENESDKSEETDKIEYPLEMWFSSGVGAWSTKLVIHSNGSFEGEYIGSEAETGEEYPNGTMYECKFSGYFSKPKKVNDYTYSLSLESLEIEGEVGQTRIEDGMLIKTWNPYGLMNIDDSGYAKEFLLYAPNAPTSEMREEFLSWWPERFGADPNGMLGVYGLQNLETSDGFFTYREE